MATVSGIYSDATEGTKLHKEKLSAKVRFQAMNLLQFGQLVKSENHLGANKGDTVNLEKVLKLAKNTTVIPELASLPVKKNSINEVQVTIAEYGNAVSYTGRAKTYAEFNLDSIMQEVISRNVAETKDAIIGAAFQTADTFWTPTGTASVPTGTFDSNGTVSTSSTRNFQGFDLRQIRKNMRKNNTPTFDGRFYVGVLSATASAALYEDTATGGITDVMKYTSNAEQLIKGEIGSYFGFRLVEETNVLADTLGTKTHEGEAIFFGDDAIGEAVAKPESVFTKDWDWGRFLGIAWYGYFGWKKIWDFTGDGEFRITRLWSD